MRTVVVGNEDGRRRYYDRPRSDEVPKKEGSATALLLRFSRNLVSLPFSVPIHMLVSFKRFSRSSTFSICQEKREKAEQMRDFGKGKVRRRQKHEVLLQL